MPSTAVKALGEIALRVNDLPGMRAFYSETFGLELMGDHSEHHAFFKIAEGYAEHTAVLALFHRDVEVSAERTTVDHIAFTIDLTDYETEKERLESLGLEVPDSRARLGSMAIALRRRPRRQYRGARLFRSKHRKG